MHAGLNERDQARATSTSSAIAVDEITPDAVYAPGHPA
jgi:hypothetical protein